MSEEETRWRSARTEPSRNSKKEERKKLSAALGDLQDEYAKTRYNKATNKALGMLRAKIARAKRGLEAVGKRKGGTGFFVKKSGDATVALVGFPSAGKSTLINRLANTDSKIAAYAFTTTSVVPGMMEYKNARIQLFDLPGIIEGAHIGAGGGRTVLSAAKMADLLVFVIDAIAPGQLGIILDELGKLSIFVNRVRPDIQVQDSRGRGFVLEINDSGLDKRTLEAIFAGFNLFNSAVRIRQRVSEDELIALLGGRSCYLSAIVALNKADVVGGYAGVASALSRHFSMDVIPVSAMTGFNSGVLVEGIYKKLGIITVYLQPKDGAPRSPIIVKKGSTLLTLANKIHSRLGEEVRYAYVDGPSAKFRNQRVSTAHVLQDGDAVTFKL